MRKYEISCTIIIQALSQLKSMYKDEWEVIVGNCDSLIFLGGSDATTLEYISKKLGKETISSMNRSRSYGRGGSNTMSYNKTARDLMTPDELGVMSNKNCIVFIRGLYPFFTKKYDLKKHPNYKLCGDGNKKYRFDIKKSLHTGQNLNERPESNKAVRLFEEAQWADARDAQRQHRINSRRPEMRTAKGEPCFQIKPLNREIPHYGVPAERLTQQQLEERQAAMDNIEVEEINVPYQEDARAEYSKVLEEEEAKFREHQHDFLMDAYATGDMEEDQLPTDTSVFDDMPDMPEEERGEF